MYVSTRKGFTLTELLVVIAIIAILAVVVVLTLNPAELLRQSRDSSRLSDLATLTSAINLYNTDQAGVSSYSLGSASTTYISVPDPTAATSTGNNCSGNGMPASTTYHCAATTIYRTITSYGWIPVNFSKITSGSPIGSLPVDPTNQTSSGLYYSYATNGSTFELTANPESQKYIALNASNTSMFTAGSNTTLLTAGQIANGSVSQANMKLSVASNTAFVDFSITNSLTPYIGDKITIKDSSGNTLVGWIEAAGTGETYGTQLLANTTYTNTSSLNSQNATLAAITSGCYSPHCLQMTITSSQGQEYQSLSTPIGTLLKLSEYGNEGTMSYLTLTYEMGASPWTTWTIGSFYSGWSQVTGYITAVTPVSYPTSFGSPNGGVGYLDSPSATAVLTPSATGVTIVSADGGSSQNWTSEASGFTLDDSSGYTYSITSY